MNILILGDIVGPSGRDALNKNLSNLSLSITQGFGDYKPDLNYLRKFPLINSILVCS